jgi:hypothetical protein
VNAVFEARSDDPLALERRGRDALESMPEALRKLPRMSLRLRPRSLLGIGALRDTTLP